MASVGKLPIYMRVGNSAEVHVGDFAPVIDNDGVINAQFEKADLARLFREAADSLDPPKGADAKE